MKKKIFVLATGLLALALTGCGGVTSSTSNGGNNTSNSQTTDEKVTWSGVEEVKIAVGTEFDLLDGVKCVHSTEGELTVTVKDDDYFDFDVPYGYTITYAAKDSKGTEYTVERTIVVDQGVNVQNGSFKFGKTYWTLDLPGGSAKMTFPEEEGNAYCNISATDVGTESWHIQLYQTGTSFEAGKTYELSFKARSDFGRSVSAGFEDVSNGYAMLISGYQSELLTSDWTEYSVYCTPTKDVSVVKTVIYLGQGLEVDAGASSATPADIDIDNVSVKEVTVASDDKKATFENANTVTVSTKEEFDALPAVTAKDYKGNDISSSIEIVGDVPSFVNLNTGFCVSYRVTDSEGNFSYINRRVNYVIARTNPYNMINADFDNGYQGWTRDVNQTQGNGQVEWSVANGELVADIKSGSNEAWHIQLFQNNISVVKGQIYRITFVAKASVERTVKIEVANPGNGFAVIASEFFNLTTEYQTFTMEFKSTVSCNAKVGAQLGGQGKNIVTIDRFENELIDASEATIDTRDYEAYQAINGDFKYGFYGWTREAIQGEATFAEDRESELITANIVTPGSASWHIQLSQSGRVYEKGKTYVVTVKAKALEATTVELEMSNNNGATVIKKEALNITTELTSITVEFTPDATYENGKLAILMGTSAATTITFDDITCEVKA